MAKHIWTEHGLKCTHFQQGISKDIDIGLRENKLQRRSVREGDRGEREKRSVFKKP